MSWLRKTRVLLPQEIPGLLAVLYEKIATPGLVGFHRRVASDVAASLTGGRVLDVGTGPAHLLREIARRRPDSELAGVDLSRRMLKIARRGTQESVSAGLAADTTETGSPPLGTGAGPLSIRLAQGDVRALPFRDGAFDLVVSTLSLHHWRDPARGIRECLRVTAPGGQCWIYDLRTDVPAKALAGLVTGRRFRRFILSWIFRFHGVCPQQYRPRSVAGWLDGGATVRLEVRKTHLRITIEKVPCPSGNRTPRCARDDTNPVGALACGPAVSPMFQRKGDRLRTS